MVLQEIYVIDYALFQVGEWKKVHILDFIRMFWMGCAELLVGLIVREGKHAAAGMMEDSNFTCFEELLGDNYTTECVFPGWFTG